mmetsp:Transcript_23879/g.73983  ORF Transcript_23879/g.73983 Transcript_23879/m.73983 type:complete len:205 (-) Transcript_23879:16-630(-)
MRRPTAGAASARFSPPWSPAPWPAMDGPSELEIWDWRRPAGPLTDERSMVECESLVLPSSMSAVKSSGVLVENCSLLELLPSLACDTLRSSDRDVRMLTEPPSPPVCTDARRSEPVAATPRRTRLRGCSGLSSGFGVRMMDLSSGSLMTSGASPCLSLCIALRFASARTLLVRDMDSLAPRIVLVTDSLGMRDMAAAKSLLDLQ